MAIDGHRSTFPTQVDTFTELVDLSPNEISAAARWQQLKLQATKTGAELTEFNSLTTQLANKIFTPEALNRIQDIAYQLEVFFKNNVDGYITNKQNEFNQYIDTKADEFDALLNKFSYKGNWSNTITYQQWNSITYNDETYISKVDSNLNHTPIGDLTDTYWFKAAKRGSQGIAGVGLSFTGAYNNAYSYSVGNAVLYGNSIYYCINASTGNLPTNTAYWTVFLSNSGITVSSTAPASPYNGMVWIDSSSLYNNFKYYDGSVWQVIGSTAKQISIADAGSIITATNVEDALQEIVKNMSGVMKIYTATGTGTAIVVTTDKNNFLLIAGASVTFIASANNESASTTINIDGKGAKPIYKPNTTSVPKIIAGKAYTVWYSTANSGCFFYKASAEGNAIPSHVLASDIFSTEDDIALVGTMPNRGNLTQSLSINGSITLLEGYYIGGTISQSVPTKGAATINPSNVTQTIGANQYLTGIQTINPVTFDASKVLVGTMIANTAGAMPNNGNQSTILNITDASKPTKSIASGYSSDSVITAQLDPSLASKILENNIIGGVAGTAKSAIVFTSGTNHQYQDALAPYETYTSTISPTRFKAVTVRVAGMYRVQFSMWWNSGSPLYSDYIHGQIYKNGSPYGTERSTYQNSGQAYAENLYFDIGDTIALYFWCLTSSTLPFKVGNFFLDTAELPLIEKII